MIRNNALVTDNHALSGINDIQYSSLVSINSIIISSIRVTHYYLWHPRHTILIFKSGIYDLHCLCVVSMTRIISIEIFKDQF